MFSTGSVSNFLCGCFLGNREYTELALFLEEFIHIVVFNLNTVLNMRNVIIGKVSCVCRGRKQSQKVSFDTCCELSYFSNATDVAITHNLHNVKLAAHFFYGLFHIYMRRSTHNTLYKGFIRSHRTFCVDSG